MCHISGEVKMEAEAVEMVEGIFKMIKAVETA
jgi:hypothetical protein